MENSQYICYSRVVAWMESKMWIWDGKKGQTPDAKAKERRMKMKKKYTIMTFTRPSGNVVRFANTSTNKHARTYIGILCVGAYIISHSWLLYPDGRHPPTYTLTFGKMPTHTIAFWGNVCIRTHTNNHLEMNESTKIKPTVLRTTLYTYRHTYIHTHTRSAELRENQEKEEAANRKEWKWKN